MVANCVFINLDKINPRIKTKINNDLKLKLKSLQIKVQVKCK